MRRYILNYPGDPSADVYQMTRAEFLARYPNRKITFKNGVTGEIISEYDMGDAIGCDLCNADPGEVLYLYAWRTVEKAHCQRCFDEGWAEYCVEAENE